MEEELKELLNFLNTKRPKLSPYTIEELVMYHRIVSQDRSAHCFVVKEDFENKTVGSVKMGDLLYPKTWHQPAKHPRGNLFDKKTWETAFEEWGMKMLK